MSFKLNMVSCSLYIIISLIFFSLAFAQPSLVSSDNQLWSIQTEDRYIIYSRDVSRGTEMPIYVNVTNLSKGQFAFGWKQEAEYPGIFGNMNFILNEMRTKKIDCNNSTFQDVGPYQIDDAAKIGFELNFKKGGKIWIRFPLQIQPPSIPENFPSYIESQAKFVVDSEAELNDAINNSSKNKLIYLKFGEFKGPFYINNSNSNLQIKAHPDERHEPILCGNGGDFVLAIEDSSNISIDGLKIKNAINGILLEDDMNCSISNCVIREFILDGISLNNSTNIKIEDNDIASLNSPCNITGINLTQCKNKCEVINNEIELDSSANIPVDILLDESGGNIIKISPKKEDGYNIYENKMNWLIQCDCCLNSLNDTCDCNDFIDASDNSWTLCGETL